MTNSVPSAPSRGVTSLLQAGLATVRAAVLSVLLFVGTIQPAVGQVFGFPDDPGPHRWRSVLSPYFWAVNQTGTTTYGPFEISNDISFGEIWSDLKFGGSLHYVGMVGSWGFVLDAAYLHTGTDNVPIREFARADTLSGSYDSKNFQAEAAATWGPFELPNQVFAFLAGFRFTSESTDLTFSLQTPPNSSTRDFSQSWIDPIVGGRWGIGFGKDKRWQAGARADIGGFGVGSRFAFNSQAGLGYRLIRLLSIEAAFRYLYTDYESGTAGTIDFYQEKTDQFGILFGVSFWF